MYHFAIMKQTFLVQYCHRGKIKSVARYANFSLISTLLGCTAEQEPSLAGNQMLKGLWTTKIPLFTTLGPGKLC